MAQFRAAFEVIYERATGELERVRQMTIGSGSFEQMGNEPDLESERNQLRERLAQALKRAERAEYNVRKTSEQNAALAKRVAELERIVVDLNPEANLLALYDMGVEAELKTEALNRELQEHIATLQSQLAWTPVSDGLPTEPGLYLFNNRGSVNLFTVDDDGTFQQHLDEDNEQWDAAPMRYWREYRRIELPKEGET